MRTFFLAWACLLLAIPCSAAIIVVEPNGSADYTTIQGAIDKAELMDAVEQNGKVELTVVGKLESGQYIPGSDTVRIIQPRRHSWKRRGHYRLR